MESTRIDLARNPPQRMGPEIAKGSMATSTALWRWREIPLGRMPHGLRSSGRRAEGHNQSQLTMKAKPSQPKGSSETRRSKSRGKKRARTPQNLPVVRPDTAGIDLAVTSEIWVAAARRCCVAALHRAKLASRACCASAPRVYAPIKVLWAITTGDSRRVSGQRPPIPPWPTNWRASSGTWFVTKSPMTSPCSLNAINKSPSAKPADFENKPNPSGSISLLYPKPPDRFTLKIITFLGRGQPQRVLWK